MKVNSNQLMKRIHTVSNSEFHKYCLYNFKIATFKVTFFNQKVLNHFQTYFFTYCKSQFMSTGIP